MITPTKLTSPQIREGAIRYAIPIYLRQGETAESIIEKFKGDLVKTITFLRERHFEGMEVAEKKKPIKEKVTKSKPKNKPTSQEKLF